MRRPSKFRSRWLAATDRRTGIIPAVSSIFFAAGSDNEKKFPRVISDVSLHCTDESCWYLRPQNDHFAKYAAMKPSNRQLSYSRLLRGVFQIDPSGQSATIPLHLCPAAARACSTLSPARTTRTRVTATSPLPPSRSSSQRFLRLQQTRRVHSEAAVDAQDELPTKLVPIRPLPVQCYGCGAFSQTTVPDEAGYFNPDRNAVRVYTGTQIKGDPRDNPEYKSKSDVVRASLLSLGDDKAAELGLDPSLLLGPSQRTKRHDNSRSSENFHCSFTSC